MLVMSLVYIGGMSIRKEGGIRAVLNSSQNCYEHGTLCASLMPAEKTAVNCDATSLPCHVGLGMDDESGYGGTTYAMGMGDGDLSGIIVSTGLDGRTKVRAIRSATTRLEVKY